MFNLNEKESKSKRTDSRLVIFYMWYLNDILIGGICSLFSIFSDIWMWYYIIDKSWDKYLGCFKYFIY